MKNQSLLISVHGKWCELYKKGIKRTEVRKTTPIQDFNGIVYIYNTSTHQIELKAILHDIIKLKISDLRSSFLSETSLSLKEVERYTGQKKRVVLLDFFTVTKLSNPVSLSEMRKIGITPPQTYYYLADTKLSLN